MCQFTSWLTEHFDYVLELIATNLPLGRFAHAQSAFYRPDLYFSFSGYFSFTGVARFTPSLLAFALGLHRPSSADLGFESLTSAILKTCHVIPLTSQRGILEGKKITPGFPTQHKLAELCVTFLSKPNKCGKKSLK